MNRFSKDNQPEGRGRKPTPKDKKRVRMEVSVAPETKEWLSRRRGLSGIILDDYVQKAKE